MSEKRKIFTKKRAARLQQIPLDIEEIRAHKRGLTPNEVAKLFQHGDPNAVSVKVFIRDAIYAANVRYTELLKEQSELEAIRDAPSKRRKSKKKTNSAAAKPVVVSADDFDFEAAPRYRKTATIGKNQVRVAKKSETIVTLQPDKKGGFVETKNIAKPGDRIVTRSPGDSYVIKKEKFSNLYETDPNDKTRFRSKSTGRAVRVTQDVQIKAPWGEMQHIKKGGVVFKSDIDGSVYGNQKNTFDADFSQENAKSKSNLKTSPKPSKTSYKSPTVKELRAEAAETGVKLKSRMKKADILKALGKTKFLAPFIGSGVGVYALSQGATPAQAAHAGVDAAAGGALSEYDKSRRAGYSRIASAANAAVFYGTMGLFSQPDADANKRKMRVSRKRAQSNRKRQSQASRTRKQTAKTSSGSGNKKRGTQNRKNIKAIIKSRRRNAQRGRG